MLSWFYLHYAHLKCGTNQILNMAVLVEILCKVQVQVQVSWRRQMQHQSCETSVVVQLTVAVFTASKT